MPFPHSKANLYDESSREPLICCWPGHIRQLAELHRRSHDVVSLANGRAGHPQFRVGGHRHRAGGGARARHRAAFGGDAR